MNWTDTVKATVLAALAERPSGNRRLFDGEAPGWARRDVWLRRAARSRPRARSSTLPDPATPCRSLPSPRE
jgi:hypothetical protein